MGPMAIGLWSQIHVSIHLSLYTNFHFHQRSCAQRHGTPTKKSKESVSGEGDGA